ncbi:hypothetical protein [Ktedonospora formicarum]|uniref:Uncharacterized protein n=1 Tax=Ktedonospora formicarum TaxID=2778364 RepID=A0A8J3I094_9CHLR|nr:hypothetical protein [Ktedonospora formicarum]GHO44430.1 hypothetical protein KSX_25930 [Ktedonospora formicarum]
MSLQICIKTHQSLQQLATEIRALLNLPPFTNQSLVGAPYCQFETLGMFVLVQRTEEDERDPEVREYPYCFNLQSSFTEHSLDTDEMEYNLQPYYARLLAFHLNIATACHEKKQIGRHWQVRYHYFHKNQTWNESLLFGEPGWEPAVIVSPPTPWRTMMPSALM